MTTSRELSGCWRMTTETGSRYVLDLDQGLIIREPDREGGESLRRDHEVLPLHAVEIAELGASAVLYLEITPGVVTERVTSHVVAMEQFVP